MKLLMRMVQRVEAQVRQVRRRKSRPKREPVGIVWVSDDAGPDVAPGDDVVEDVYVEEGDPPEWHMRPRARRDDADLGDVYGAGGELLGRVVEIEGSLVTWEAIGGGEAAGAAS